MKIVRIRISRFRGIRWAEIFPAEHNVLLGPNNTGKTAILEALNLLLNPEITARSHAIDENDFYRRAYVPVARLTAPSSGSEAPKEGLPPVGEVRSELRVNTEEAEAIIRIEAVLAGLSAADEDFFRDNLVPWRAEAREVVEAAGEGESGMNSAMTFGRMAFYRDIDRLRHLVETRKDGIRRGMFLAVVNERGYVVRGRQRVNEVYATYHGTLVDAGVTIPACPGPNGRDYELLMPANPVLWGWSCESRDGQVIPSRGMRHFWLEPIPVYPRTNPKQL